MNVVILEYVARLDRGTRLNINQLHALVCNGMPEDELFKTLQERFERFALRRIEDPDDAKDVVQKALIAIARDYRQIDFEVSFSAWAYRVLDIRLLDYYKTRERQTLRTQRIDTAGENLVPTSQTSDLKHRLIACLRKLHRMNPQYARIINLHYQGYRTGEICRSLNLTPNALYIALSRARSMLKKCLETGRIKR